MLLVAAEIGMISAAQKTTDQVPPNELVLYIREAKRRGVDEAKIKQQAVAIGWSGPVVEAALAYEKDGKGLPANNVSAKADATADPPANLPAGRNVPDDYRIGAGDVLQISVFKEPEVSVPIAPVRPDGRITVPLIKEILVAGLTPREADQVIAEGLKKYIEDANVTVLVTNFNSKKIYVIGAVRREAPIPYTYGMTVMQALSEAGGLTDYAKRKKIYIIHRESGSEYHINFNYDEVVKGIKIEQNILLLPNDTIVIPH